MIGFVNLGAVDEQLAALEQSSFPAIATRVLTVMVRGIFYRLTFPLANFPTAGIASVNLFEILWQAVELLERCDFTVVFQTADGASPNRSYFHMHQNPASASEVTHKAINPYSATGGKAIFFFC